MIEAHISRRPLFWIILSSTFLGGTVFSIKYFSKAFPIVNLNISMDRKEALLAAQQLAQKYAWGPKGFEQTASFSADEMTKNFIELEGGGKKTLNNIIKEKYYAPYTWSVRHFKEFSPNETIIEFTPEGKPYGFEEKIAENEPGASLSADKARSIAIKAAQQDWNVDFSLYNSVESSQETKPSGRIDHIFVYERNDKKIGEAPYRVQLKMSGDRLTEFSIFIKVPEAFIRRYEQMRSANNTIAQLSGTIAMLLYLFGGCILGLLFLTRRRWVIWNKPFLWSGFIGLLLVLNNISQFPLLWIGYDTALAKSTIYLKFILSLFTTFGVTAIEFGLIFTAAESLTRMAFGHQPQLWKLWSTQAAPSIQTLGRTIGGYLIVGWDVAFVTAVYLFASRFLGWWTPSSQLVDPNIIANYFPWISAIAQSLSAGFMEECLFRAIPLSCAAIIGTKRGNRTAWIVSAFILQAIIFSAAHANYPAQPAYARLVELLIPSFVFGGIYLTFGLLPSIISHFVFDVFWFALPIFLSDMFINQILVILVTILPLLVILFMRLKVGAWSELPDMLYNAAWIPTPAKIVPVVESKPTIIKETFPQKSIFFAGLIGLICWLFAAQFRQDGLPLVKKNLAQDHTQWALAQKNITLKAPWRQFSLALAQIDEEHRFVWKIDKLLYQKLLHNNYLSPAQWKIRYAQFQGDIVNRAEEYNIFLNPHFHFSPVRIAHQLPESQVGEFLLEQEARKIAHDVLKNEYRVEPENLIEVSAISKKQPERLDWIFTFNNSLEYVGIPTKELQGQARIVVKIAGNQVVDHYQYVFVPEKWERADRQEQTILQLLTTFCLILLAILLLIAGIRAIILWINHRFAAHIFLIFFGILLGKSIIQFFNLLPVLTSGFKTSAPLLNQFLILISSSVITMVTTSGGIALLASYIQNATMEIKPIITTMRTHLSIGFSLGSMLAGFWALAVRFSPSMKPLWADYTHAAAQFPGISCALSLLTTFISETIIFYLVIKTIDYITHGGTSRLWAGIPSCIAFGILLNSINGIDHLASWFILGAIYGLLLFVFYVQIIRFDRTLVPIIIGSSLTFKIIQQGIFNAYSGAVLGSILSIILINIFALWWSNTLATKKHA